MDTFVKENQKYMLLVNPDDQDDMCLRKVVKEQNQDYLVKLDSDEEFEEIMALIGKKNRKEDKNE